MNDDPSQRPDRLAIQESRLVTDISQLSRDVLILSEQINAPMAEEARYVFGGKDSQIRLPGPLTDFLGLSPIGPKLVAVEVAFSTTRDSDYMGLEVSFELTSSETIVARRDAAADPEQGFTLSLEDTDGSPLDLDYGTYTKIDISRMIMSLIYDRAERAAFPDGYLKKIDVQSYGTALLIREALEKRCDSLSRKRIVEFPDEQGHTLHVTESSDTSSQAQSVEVVATTTAFGEHEGLLAVFESSTILEITEPYDRSHPAEIMQMECVRDFASDKLLNPEEVPIPEHADYKNLKKFNDYLHRMRVWLEAQQPTTLNYDDIDDNS